MPLDVMSSGSTPDEARTAVDEALHLFLATAMDIGTLDDILLEAGYTLREGNWVSPMCVETERRTTDVGAL